MVLTAGTRLGSYEITGALGAGGMGEVYRATDTNLKRDVAIKVLPTVLAEDADRLARFQREAEVLASLNHPNIAQIYGLERSDGTTALVMELVEGPTLADRIAEGPIPPDEALGISMQIADALEAAHDLQIVHRDLKPANIKLRPDGTVKVLDFGIAKALETQRGTGGPGPPSLTTPAMTQAGVLLGTAAYMSPEQARGKAIDERADIWAFGCVLYEMLTGQPAFGGDDVSVTLARVLERDTNMHSLPAAISPAVGQTITLCLRKDARQRVADIRDVKLALEGAFDPGIADPPVAAVPKSILRRALPIAAALLVGSIAAGLTVWAVIRPGTPEVARFDVTPESGFTVMSNSPSVAISPDGTLLAYLVGGNSTNGADELRLRRLSRLDSTTLVARGPIGSPFFSPDGSQIGFYENLGAVSVLKRVSTQGGPASTIAESPRNLRGASWGADGTIIFATSDPASGLWRVPSTGGDPQLLTTPDAIGNGAGDHLWPEILPGGDAVLFAIAGATEEESQIAVLLLATGEHHVVLRGGSFPHYSPTGHLLYGRAGTLWAVRFDPIRLKTLGDPVPVQAGVVTKGTLGATEVGLSSNGTFVYVSGAPRGYPVQHVVWVDAAGNEVPVPVPPRAYQGVALSPDGTSAAFQLAQDEAIWISDLARGTLERLPPAGDPGVVLNGTLFFSADGRHVVTGSRRGGRLEITSQTTDDAGSAETLVRLDESVTGVWDGDWSPDGTRLVLTVGGETGFDLGFAAVGEPDSFREIIATPAAEFDPAISPDGRWLAYVVNETGTPSVYVQRFPEGGGRLAVSIGGGVEPRWSRDGNSLTYVRLDGGQRVAITRVPVTGLGAPDGSPVFGKPADLFQWKYTYFATAVRSFDMTADGERFLMIQDPKDEVASRLVLVQNWFEELKHKLPRE